MVFFVSEFLKNSATLAVRKNGNLKSEECKSVILSEFNSKNKLKETCFLWFSKSKGPEVEKFFKATFKNFDTEN